ncbi:hypothetical protein [Terricaulis sp.]|uniref:hypothetical protein n=1 Tax=Terricaulis sp. TaxID=2768686 RepID=UPI003783E244
MAEPAWDRGEGEDGEQIVFVETVSTARKGRGLLVASALVGGLMLGVGIVGAVWGGTKLLSTYEEFQRQTELVQEADPAERDGVLTEAARLDERDYVAATEYWRLRSEYEQLCRQAERRGRGECREWYDPPPLPEGATRPERDRRR